MRITALKMCIVLHLQSDKIKVLTAHWGKRKFISDSYESLSSILSKIFRIKGDVW